MSTVVSAPIQMRWRNTHVFDRLAGRVSSNGARFSYNFARRGTKYVREYAPVRTGYLKSQVKWKKVKDKHYMVYVNGSINAETGAFYSIYVEYGTRNMAAQPFWRPGIERAIAEFRAEMRTVFRELPGV